MLMVSGEIVGSAENGCKVPDWILQLIGMAGAGVAVYAGIRSDLAAMAAHLKDTAETANHAHRRIDDLLMRGEK